MPNEGTWGHIQLAVIRVEFVDGRAALRRVTLSKNFLKVTESLGPNIARFVKIAMPCCG